MAFNRITQLDNPIAELPDRITGQAVWLKEYFDGNAWQMANEHNAMASALESAVGASQIGTEPIDGIGGTNVQESLASLKDAIDGVALGEIPDGSVGFEKLTEQVQQTILPLVVTKVLPSAGWALSGTLYRQQVAMAGLAADAKVDFDASPETLAALEAPIIPVNDAGTLYAYTAEKPAVDVTMQASVYRIR